MDNINDKTKVDAYDETLAQAVDFMVKKLVEMLSACGLEEVHCKEVRRSIFASCDLTTFDMDEWLKKQTEQDQFNINKLMDIIETLTDFCQW